MKFWNKLTAHHMQRCCICFQFLWYKSALTMNAWFKQSEYIVKNLASVPFVKSLRLLWKFVSSTNFRMPKRGIWRHCLCHRCRLCHRCSFCHRCIQIIFLNIDAYDNCKETVFGRMQVPQFSFWKNIKRTNFGHLPPSSI